MRDIGHKDDVYDVAYENIQARERTQILFDYSNMINALVIGTGDMSELALGWCTYNGDHMSNYAVNIGVPKTLVKWIVKFYADFTESKILMMCLTSLFPLNYSQRIRMGISNRKQRNPSENMTCMISFCTIFSGMDLGKSKSRNLPRLHSHKSVWMKSKLPLILFTTGSGRSNSNVPASRTE